MSEGGHLVAEDARMLQAASCTDEALERICPYPLEPPISPERATSLAGLRLSLDDLKATCLNGVAETDFLLVEGAGGFYSPLASGVINADLAAIVPLPELLVAKDCLDAINHTLDHYSVEVLQPPQQCGTWGPV